MLTRILLLGFLIAATPALADDYRDCSGPDADLAIAACTRLIEGPKEGAHLEESFYNRGSAYRTKGDYNRAIADFNQAIRFGNSRAEKTRIETIAEYIVQKHRAQQSPGRSEPAKPTAEVPGNQAERRIALVIGNSAYRNVKPLRNPPADAHLVADEFRKLGFAEVIQKNDLTLAELSSELKAFGDKVQNADWAVVYYAGHGIEMGGVNYLIPVDAELRTSTHVEEEAISLDRVLSKVEDARKLRLVIVDACRDNPFAQRLANAEGGTRSVGRGLAAIEPNSGVLVAYSARDGHLAQDGEEANSPFALALVQNLDEPGLEISLLFRKVADAVWNKTHGEQEPFTYGSLPAEALFFKPAGR